MKRIRTKSQQGIGAAAIIAIVGVIVLVGVLGYVAYSTMNNKNDDTSEVSDTSEDAGTDDDAAMENEDSKPAGEELKGVSVGMARADVEKMFGEPTSPCISYPDTSIADTGCVYKKDDVIGAGNSFEVSYKADKVTVVAFTDNATNTIQQLTKDGLETVQ